MMIPMHDVSLLHSNVACSSSSPSPHDSSRTPPAPSWPPRQGLQTLSFLLCVVSLYDEG